MNKDDFIVEIMKKELLTPVVYKIDEDDLVTIIGFFDRNTTISSIYDVQSRIEAELKRTVQIYDFRDFEEGERLEILKNTDLLYSENDFVKSLFETAMVEDLRIALARKEQTLQRDEKIGTVYFS